MAAITASLVKDLREKTGAGMMDCKNALTEVAGDIEAAVDWLRKKGKKSQACLDLADKVDQCRPKHRCKSPACPECATPMTLVSVETSPDQRREVRTFRCPVCREFVTETTKVPKTSKSLRHGA